MPISLLKLLYKEWVGERHVILIQCFEILVWKRVVGFIEQLKYVIIQLLFALTSHVK